MERSFLINNSPIASPGRANVSGNGQKICNLITDFQGLIQKWNLQLSAGKTFITEITQLKISSCESQEDNMNNYPDGLRVLCDQLDLVITELDFVVRQMEKIKDQLIAVAKLEEYQQQRGGMDLAEMKPLFLTWPVRKFGDVANEIKEAYEKELKVKKCIAENVAHCVDRDTLNFHKIAWVHQVYIPNSIKVQFESLLAETGQQ